MAKTTLVAFQTVAVHSPSGSRDAKQILSLWFGELICDLKLDADEQSYKGSGRDKSR